MREGDGDRLRSRRLTPAEERRLHSADARVAAAQRRRLWREILRDLARTLSEDADGLRFEG